MTSYNNSIKLHHINTIMSVTYKVLVQVITPVETILQKRLRKASNNSRLALI